MTSFVKPENALKRAEELLEARGSVSGLPVTVVCAVGLRKPPSDVLKRHGGSGFAPPPAGGHSGSAQAEQASCRTLLRQRAPIS